MKENINQTITTNRLHLRPFEMDDVSSIQKLASDKRIAQGTFIPHPYEEKDAVEFVRNTKKNRKGGKLFNFAITLKGEDTLIGSIGIKHIEREHQRGELGYWIGVPWWNKGYATEAVKGVVDFGFRDLDLHRIFANHFKSNPASGKVLQKAGFSREGELKDHIYRFGTYRNLVVYGILREHYQTGKR